MRPALTPHNWEWATRPYSIVAPMDRGGEWTAYILIEDRWAPWYVGPKETAMRVAKKHGNRLRRLEASRAPVHQR
jgi:hypothetical protein